MARIGILTGGGDCPGLNAVIRAVVRKGVNQYGHAIVGFKDGWRGVLDNNGRHLTPDNTSGILHRGGTILGSSRTNPFKEEEGVERVKESLEAEHIECLIAVGGEDTLGVAAKLTTEGINVVGVPKTIDNDLSATDFTFGFNTAVQICTDAIDRLHTTAESHNRVIVLEVMGRNAGWIATYSGIAGGADAILVPENPFDIDEVCEHIRHRHQRGHSFSIVVVAEGAKVAEGQESVQEEQTDAFGHVRLGGIGVALEHEIERRTGYETRVTILGHIQRGGTPTAFDRVLATRFGIACDRCGARRGLRQDGRSPGNQDRPGAVGRGRRGAQDPRPRAVPDGRGLLRLMYQGLIDLRSDTVTRPTPEMRKAMAEAEVGDDVFGDDPTVNSLQEFAASLLGKEAGLFVPTGSMGNQVALGSLSRPGDEVVCEANAHFLHYEGGSVAAHLGLVARTLPGDRGVIQADAVAATLRKGSEHNPHSAVVAIENTHNAGGGRVFPLDDARAISKVCRERDVAVHLDGARLFNAQAATGVAAKEWAECADTVTFCFSKGLGAPIGSMVVGDGEVIAHARKLRKRLGGGMRQVGVIASAARVALESGIDRLAEDHVKARRLAEGLNELHPEAVDLSAVETNMVYLNLLPFGKRGPEVADTLRNEGIVTLGAADHVIRLVTHRDVTEEDVEVALVAFAKVLTTA